jgi:hypothetical protein
VLSKIYTRLALLPLILIARTASAADFFIDPDVSSFATSNVYLNQEEQWDVELVPRLDTGIEFADFWAAGYGGQVDLYTRHADLNSHSHEVYVFADPAWGDESQNEFFAKLSGFTRQNSDSYSDINYLSPQFELKLEMEPEHFFRWALSQSVSYRWFYEDAAITSLDFWTFASTTFTAQTRTTLSPRVGFGFRYYTDHASQGSRDRSDQQIEAGIHVSQSLWQRGGLQADYAYLHAFEDSSLIVYKYDTAEFSYIGEDFLFTGHTAYVGLKQLFNSGFRFGLGLRFDTRTYGGWKAMKEVDNNETQMEYDRQDKRLSPDCWLEYVYWPDENDSKTVPEFKTAIAYSYLRQWSNDDWYDTDEHVVRVNLGLAWLL